MKLFVVATLITAFMFVGEAASTAGNQETINCNDVGSIVETLAKIGRAYILDLINSAIANTTSFQFTKFENILNETLQDMEISLTSTMERLLQPIKEQLNHHLPLPPTSLPTESPNSEENPAESCKDIYTNNPDAESGYYWIQASPVGSPERVYCKMDADCGNMTGGWMRVAYIDMTNSSHQCPSELTLLTRNEEPRRLCDVASYTCPGVHFTTHGVSYSPVYGKIKAYQNGYPAALYYGYHSIDESRGYVHGVSLTHGQNPRKHIWTFAGAIDESPGAHPETICPCTNSVVNPASIPIPSFVGNDYFCDTSLVNTYSSYTKELYPNNPLWDGEGCGASSTCCSVPNLCGNNSPPWFIKRLPSSTTEDVEMRVCKPCYYGSTPIEQVEIYVQ